MALPSFLEETTFSAPWDISPRISKHIYFAASRPGDRRPSVLVNVVSCPSDSFPRWCPVLSLWVTSWASGTEPSIFLIFLLLFYNLAISFCMVGNSTDSKMPWKEQMFLVVFMVSVSGNSFFFSLFYLFIVPPRASCPFSCVDSMQSCLSDINDSFCFFFSSLQMSPPWIPCEFLHFSCSVTFSRVIRSNEIVTTERDLSCA